MSDYKTTLLEELIRAHNLPPHLAQEDQISNSFFFQSLFSLIFFLPQKAVISAASQFCCLRRKKIVLQGNSHS